MDKTTNILKLCRYCGEVLAWEYAKEKRWNGRCPCGVEYFDLEKPERVPLPTEAILLARVAELDAAIANERGEGKPPCEGWEWNLSGEIPSACWHNGESVVYMEHAYEPEPATPAHYWLWWVPGMPGCQRAETARDAMRKASEMVKP